MISCLDNIIGLTDKSCNCYDGSKPVDFDAKNVSESGYFITDEDYGFPVLDQIASGIDCGDPDNIFQVMERARTSAINSFELDVQAALLNRFSKTVSPFTGSIGQRKATVTKTLNNSFGGIQIRPKRIKDAKLVITGIWAAFSEDATFDLTIGSNNPEFTPATVTMTATAGTFVKKDLSGAPIEIPFYSGAIMEQLRYSFTYAKADIGTSRPLDNTFACCSYNPPWKLNLSAAGVETNTIGTVNESEWGSNLCYGLIVEGYITCDATAWVCSLDELDGYDVKQVLARAIQLKASVFLADYILQSTNLNVYTLLKREQIYGVRNNRNKQYFENVSWLVNNLPQRSSGCYKCKDSLIRKRSL